VDGIDLNYPDETWSGFFRDHFGPSVLWALIGIGASHIILAPSLGARYGVFAIWIVGLIYLIKWGGWELGIRYNYGTGKNPVEGYEELPGPERWGQWLTFFIYLFLWTNILGAVAGGASAFLNAFVAESFGVDLGILPWYVVLVGVAGTLVFLSRYQWLENVMKLFVIGLAFLIILGLFISPPSLSTVGETAFATPDVTSPIFLALFAGAAAYMPVGLSSSISIGSWSMAKNEGAEKVSTGEIDPNDPEYTDYVKSWMRTGMRDYNLAFVFSFVLMISMILLATSVLYGTENIPQGGAVPFAVGSLLQQSYGAWAFYAMMIGALAALYSTVIGNIDATARVCSDILGMVREDVEDTERWRKILVVLISVFSVFPVLLIGDFPVVLVTFSAALIGVFQVFFYVSNYYLVRENLPEEFQPSSTRKAYYYAGFVLIALFGLLGALNNFGIVGA
jgi:Mn2+/Fe2+ NRAMP family transporter